ncbi:MAG: glutamyl-tRNA reductase, partial [Chloroflexota bacterium]|nr:glutamyl-tRNA reductase [Chloroflexota bacterium]
MHILALGLNHQTAPVAVREGLALEGGRLAGALAAARAETREAVVLATCNRTEIYAVTAHVESGFRALRRLLVAQHAGGPTLEPAALEPFLYEWTDAGAVRHLLRVAAGLDSLIVGEPQILGQVRDAYGSALAAGTTGPVLAQLLRTALSAGKEARTATEIARGAASIAHAAVELARTEIGGLRDRAVLVIGAGKMAALAAGALAGHGARLTIANRTADRAEALAAQLGGRATAFERLGEALVDCDVVIASTGAPEPVITPALLEPVLPLREGRPLLFLDIAVPRDVDPAVDYLPGVALRNIDHLQGTV